MRFWVVQLLTFASYLFIARALLSWFRIGPSSPFYPIVDGLNRVTDPVIDPIRRVLPSTGMFDFSIIIVYFGIRFFLIPLAQNFLPA